MWPEDKAIQKNTIQMVVLGDIILGDDPDFYMSGVIDTLKNADIRVGQLEVPYTKRAKVFEGMSREPDRLLPLAGCMDAVTLAGNHIYDAKEAGIEDTLAWLDEHQIKHTGGGMDLAMARAGAVVEYQGGRLGILNYNCTGPKATWASQDKAGAAYVDIMTCYDLDDVANPGGPPEHTNTFPKLESLRQMCRDIRELKKQCDIVAVYFHKGIVHKPVALADYEYIVSYAAIEAGADVVFGSHSHILHGIEIYKGKTIFHGLGNGVTWVPSLRADYYKGKNTVKNDVFDPEDWAKKRIQRFGFVPDPEYPTYPFHPEAVYTVIAKCIIRDGCIVQTRCIPALVGKDGVTRTVGRKNGGESVFNYLVKITDGAGLNACFSWEDDEIIIKEKQGD